MELEVLDNQNIPEVLAAYDSTDDLSDIDIDNFNDVEEFSVGKTFKDWDQVADFMKKYASIKGHGIRIGGGGRATGLAPKVLVTDGDPAVNDFYIMRNSLAEEKFNERWENLLQDYPQASDYLLRSLGCCTKSWARAFTSRYFTAGVQSTSRNEGENSTLKHLFGSSSLSLCELFEALEERYQEEIDYCKFEEQMNLSFYYHAMEIDLEVMFSKEKKVDESEQYIDNLFNCPQIQMKSFLNDFSIILESWEVIHLSSSGTSHFVHLLNDGTFLCTCMLGKSHGYPCCHFYRIITLTSNARFHIGLVNRRWYKDTLQGTDITNNEFIVISSNISISTSKAHILPTQFLHDEFDVNMAEEFVNNENQSPDEIFKTISKKRKFGELWGLGRKIMLNAIEDSSKDLYHELLGFFTSIQNRTLPHRVINSKVNYGGKFNHNINNDSCIVGIRNPVKRKSKGRPKSKRIANAFEKSDTKTKTSYNCKLCKKRGIISKLAKKNQTLIECYDDNEELSTTSTSHENGLDMSDTEEPIGPSNPVVLISQPIDFQDREHTQRQYSICHRKEHNSRTCSNKNLL
ncbi:protein far1-related sequence 5-like [Gigaspora margarita]|uniref:Protein far1-related sequence 5-like n=1 Tax=Gigaspora margarita TaxID=4874 RepID=A0A8H4B306_GIGMA|nr:protein far1-related sequence 5-like [Gigaspora margarita]